MDEYIDRRLCEIVAEFDQHYRLIVTLSKIRKLPAADVAPVVRCRECARAEESVHPNTVVCVEHGKTMLESDFCSYGERRKTNEN